MNDQSGITDIQRRRNVVTQIRASVELEGFVLPGECERIDERFVRGDLTSEQHTDEYLRVARSAR